MKKNLDNWNQLKKKIDLRLNFKFFKQREIVFINMGLNIGSESNGKGDLFLRPVIIFKKINNSKAIVIPMSSVKPHHQETWYQMLFEFKEKQSRAMIGQIKTIDARRIFKKIGTMPIVDFERLRGKVQLFFNFT